MAGNQHSYSYSLRHSSFQSYVRLAGRQRAFFGSEKSVTCLSENDATCIGSTYSDGVCFQFHCVGRWVSFQPDLDHGRIWGGAVFVSL